jgi:ketosteroid isomerase-like protein
MALQGESLNHSQRYVSDPVATAPVLTSSLNACTQTFTNFIVVAAINDYLSGQKKNMWRNSLSAAVLLVVILPLSITAQHSFKATKRQNKTATAIRAVLQAQSEAWNRGGIEGYMAGYWRSNETVFISGDSLTRGWQTVLDRYKKNYDSREKMGMLTFSDLEITPIGNDSAVVIGRWHLQRAKDEPHGRFTLIFRRTKQGWRIVHDHTSAAN